MGGHESDRLHYIRTCEMCGAVMQNVAPNKRLCPACVKQNQHQRDQKRRWPPHRYTVKRMPGGKGPKRCWLQTIALARYVPGPLRLAAPMASRWSLNGDRRS